jgi:hypothetical protein
MPIYVNNDILCGIFSYGNAYDLYSILPQVVPGANGTVQIGLTASSYNDYTTKYTLDYRTYLLMVLMAE